MAGGRETWGPGSAFSTRPGSNTLSKIGQGRVLPGAHSGISTIPQKQELARQKTPSALPRFMQPTTSSKQGTTTPHSVKPSETAVPSTASAPSAQQVAPPLTGQLACTPVLNITAKASPSEPGTSSSSNGSKWKSTGGSDPVFSVIARGSRQATQQPCMPSKPQATAPRTIRQPTSTAHTPQHSSSSSKSLSLRGGSSSSHRALSSSSSSGASTPVLGSRLRPSHAHLDSISSSCSTPGSAAADTSASTPPRRKDCKSLVRVLTFDDPAGSASASSGLSDVTNTPDTACKAPARSISTKTKSRIPAAPGTAGARTGARMASACVGTAAVNPAAAGGATARSVLAASTAAAGRGVAAGADSKDTHDAGDSALEPFAAFHMLGQDSSSGTWLSEGCSEEGLQQLAAGHSLPGEDALAELTGQQTSDAKAGAVTSQDTSGTSAEGTVLQQQQQQQPNSPADAAIANPGAASSHGKQEGTKGSSTAMRVCMVLLWSGVLLVVGSLLAAAWLAPMLQEPVAAAGDDDLLYTFEADVGSLAVVPRCYAA